MVRMTRALLSAVVAAAALSAGDWPRFRGPNGSGVDSSTGLPAEFGPSKNLAWKRAVPFSHSSPIVAANRVFLTAHEGESLITLAFDAASGRPLWRRDERRARAHKIFRMNDPASPTPAADEGNVYVFFPDLGLISYTFDGRERWRHPLGPFDNFYGMASSPVVAGDLLLLLCDQRTGSFLLALDKQTGRPRWKTDRPAASLGWSVPIVYSPSTGQSEIVAIGSGAVDSYYLSTGERRWWLPIGSDGSMGSPVLHAGTVLVTSLGHDQPWMIDHQAGLERFDRDKNGRISREEFQGYKEWAEHFGWMDVDKSDFLDAAEWNSARSFGLGEYGAVAVPLGGSGQLPSTRVRWRFKRNLPYVPAPILYQNVFYMVRTGGIITSLDPSTGALLKQGRTEKALGEYWASPVAADGKIFLLGEDGKLSVLKAGAQWEVLAVNDLTEESYATPAISNGRIFVRTRGTLYCFAARP